MKGIIIIAIAMTIIMIAAFVSIMTTIKITKMPS